MEPDYKMTMQEAKEETRQFKKIFTNVRLIDQMVLHRIEQEERMKFQDGHCNDFWNKNCPCENCVSLKAFEGKTQKTKLEFMDSDIYQVTARYVEIDGTPYVMEMFKCLDSTSLIDVAGQEKIVSKFARYNEKVYKDALTGAYNRRYFEEHIKKMTGSMGVAMIIFMIFYMSVHLALRMNRLSVNYIKVMWQTLSIAEIHGLMWYPVM